MIFQPLTRNDVRAIALGSISQIQESLSRWGKTLTIEPDALERLVQEGHSVEYGARFLKRVIDEAIELPISQRWKDANDFHVTVQDDRIVILSGVQAVMNAEQMPIAV